MTAICLLMDRSTFLSFAIYSYIYYDEMPFPASNYFWKYTKQIIVIFLLKRIICLSKILNNVTMLL